MALPRLAAVIAAYDEVANIEEFAGRLKEVLDSVAPGEWEAVFVVAGSDGTLPALERLRDLWGAPFRILYREAPQGLGFAFREGFAALSHATSSVVTMDADLNHRPEELPRLLGALEREGADIVVGSRFVEGGEVQGVPAWKRVLSGSFNSVMRLFWRGQALDKTSGYRVYRARVVRELEFTEDGYAFLPELLMRAQRAGLRIVEVPIQFVFRRRGVSKMSFWPTVASYLRLLGRDLTHRLRDPRPPRPH